MKTIVVPTDFSTVSNNAMNYAAAMAKETGASIMLFHAYQVPVSMTDVPIVLVSVEELQKNAESKIEEIRKKLERQVGDGVKIYSETKLGDAIDELENLCQKIKPFAVVMGTKGATGLERVLFGSTTLTAIKHLTWPVIIIPPGKEYSTIKKAGFACDFREVVETTPMKPIKDFLKEYHAELHVLNVDFHAKHFRAETPEQSMLLNEELQGLQPQYHFIENEKVEEGINKFADDNHLDLVITIPKKHKLLESLFKKSHTRELVFHSHVPIMCVHE